MLRNRKLYKVDNNTEVDNNTGMENIDQVMQVEGNERVEVEDEVVIEKEIETDTRESSSRDQTDKAENMMDNTMFTILLNEIRAQSTKFNDIEKKMEQKFKENARDLEGKLLENASKLEQKLSENASSINNLERQLGENINTIENKMDQKLNENVNRIEQKLMESTATLENRLRQDLLHSFEQKLSENSDNLEIRLNESVESRMKENNEKVESKLQDQTDRIKDLNYELDRVINVELSDVHGKVGGLGEVVHAMDSKIDKIEMSVIKALEQLELQSKETNTSINPTTDPGNNQLLESKSDKCNVQVPEQSLFRSVNIGLNDITLPKFGNGGGQNPLRFIKELENYFEIKSVPEKMKLIVVRNCLVDNAASWFEMVNAEGTRYCEFKKKFIDHFWDRTRQEEIRAKLNQGKFNPRGHLKMADYFIQLGQLARLLEPPIATSEVISLIANHYATEIRSAIIVSKPRDCEEMVNLLKELQGNQGISQHVIREPGSNRNQTRAEVNSISHGGGAHYAPNRYMNQRVKESPPRDIENGNNRPNRNTEWNRETYGYGRPNRDNDRQNRWGPDRHSRYDRTQGDRPINPRINYLNINRRARYDPGRRRWDERERETDRRRGYDRREWERVERSPSPRNYPPNNGGNNNNERRPFPAGIDHASVNGLINRQNARLPSQENQGGHLSEN